MTAATKPVPLQRHQPARVTGSLPRSFHEGPVHAQAFPGDHGRGRALRSPFGAILHDKRRYGRADRAPTAVAACRLNPGDTEVTIWRMARAGFRFQRAVGRFEPAERRRLLPVRADPGEVHKGQMAAPLTPVGARRRPRAPGQRNPQTLWVSKTLNVCVPRTCTPPAAALSYSCPTGLLPLEPWREPTFETGRTGDECEGDRGRSGGGTGDRGAGGLD